VSDPDCVRCALSDNCEKHTKSHVGEEKNGELDDMTEDVAEVKPITPLDYLLKCLEGKFDKIVEDHEKATMYKFAKGGNTVIAVVVGKNGRIKIISKKDTKMYGQFTNVSDVEDVLKEML
jgi:hypothetical protein